MVEVGLSGLLLDYPHSGSAVYTRQLTWHLPAAAPDMRFHLFLRQAGALPGVRASRLTSPFVGMNRGAGVGARLDKLAWETWCLPLASLRRHESVLHSPYFAAPAISRVPVVVTIHDVIPLVLPGYHRSSQSALYARFMAQTARRAAHIITVSNHARDDILRCLGVPPDRVTVTYEAVDERFYPGADEPEAAGVRERYGLPERYVLYLGGAERRKNIETLVRAWHEVRGVMRDAGVRLVIVADFPPPDPLYPDVPSLVRTLKLERDVILISSVTEVDKPAVFRAATTFAFPSRYEGFGFPPLEAMACGVPVLCSNASSLPEVVGDAAVLIDPDDVGGWAGALGQIVGSEARRAELVERGLINAGRFSWQRTAEQTVRVYREVAGA